MSRFKTGPNGSGWPLSLILLRRTTFVVRGDFSLDTLVQRTECYITCGFASAHELNKDKQLVRREVLQIFYWSAVVMMMPCSQHRKRYP